MAVYLDYDQEALDIQYEHRNIVSNVEEFTEKSRAESARVRAAAKGQFDVSYGDHADEMLDIYYGAGATEAGSAPIIVYFHGGRWSMGSKSGSCECAEGINKSGAHFISVNFTMFPITDMDGLITQCRDAIAWIYHNAASFGGDPDRIHVMGKSSGGHIAGMMVTTDWQDTNGLPSNVIKGGLVISGMYDLEPVRLTFRNDALKLDEKSARRNSPIHHIPEQACPIVASVGSLESDEFRRQTREFAEAWEEAGHPVHYAEMQGRHHFSIGEDMANAASPLIAPFLELMGLAPVEA
jgi:arylformamidase